MAFCLHSRFQGPRIGSERCICYSRRRRVAGFVEIYLELLIGPSPTNMTCDGTALLCLEDVWACGSGRVPERSLSPDGLAIFIKGTVVAEFL